MGLGAEPCKILDADRRTLDDRGAVEAMCEDYRAGASVDVEHDDADRRAAVTSPVSSGSWPCVAGAPDVLEVWRPWAPDVRGTGSDATHFLAEPAS